MSPFAVADQPGRVVVEDESVEAGVPQRADHPERVVIPLAEEALLERRDRATHVAQVDVRDLVPRPEPFDRREYGGLAAHLRDGPETQLDRPGPARHQL